MQTPRRGTDEPVIQPGDNPLLSVRYTGTNGEKNRGVQGKQENSLINPCRTVNNRRSDTTVPSGGSADPSGAQSTRNPRGRGSPSLWVSKAFFRGDKASFVKHKQVFANTQNVGIWGSRRGTATSLQIHRARERRDLPSKRHTLKPPEGGDLNNTKCKRTGEVVVTPGKLNVSEVKRRAHPTQTTENRTFTAPVSLTPENGRTRPHTPHSAWTGHRHEVVGVSDTFQVVYSPEGGVGSRL